MNQGFSTTERLLKTDEFSSVFALRRSRHGRYVQVLLGEAQAHPRLGLVVAKKVAKRAHERNYMKRVLREWFRLHKQQLPAQDIVVRAKMKFEQEDFQAVWQEMQRLLNQKAP